MTIFPIILLSGIFTIIFILLHLLFLYFFSFKKTIHIIVPFVLSNLILFYFIDEIRLHHLFYSSFIINLSIFIIYVEFFLLINKGFTLSIITSFKKKNVLTHKALIKNYSNAKGAKWILFDRLNNLNKFRLINLNKNIELTRLGHFLSIVLIFLRKIFSIKDFG
jgi:hypothetical protein